MKKNSQNSLNSTSTLPKRRLSDAFKKGSFLGTVERALGVWYPNPDDEPDDTNPKIQMAFRRYLIKRLQKDWICAPREEHALGEPDLVVRRKLDEKRFDVATCYRSQMFIGEDGEPYLPWTTQETYDKFRAYEESEGTTVYVVIGLHGYADAPRFLFCLPLEKAAIDLKKSIMSSFEVKEGAALFN
ncbi:MAG TPA: hypothetical protein O0X32_03045 [Methanocorpusculum sp.]|nr:hypothetical protein [Methanocorpusculum sp.]